MKQLRLIFSINVRWWNAEAAYAINVARIFKEKGHRVWLLVNGGSPVEEKALFYGLDVITQVRLDTHSVLQQIQNLNWLLKFIDQNDIQLINSFKSNGAILFSLIKRYRPHIRYIKTRGEARPPKNNFFNRILYGTSGCHGVVAVGKTVERWIGELKLEKQRVKTIYYGASPLSDPPELMPPGGEKVLALVGRIQEVKGHIYILKALEQLRDKTVKLHFFVKDLAEFPHELEKIKRFIKLKQMDNQVTITGFQTDIGSALKKVHLGVVPSLSSEVNCRVVVEMFSLGIPVLAFPTGTLPELIKHQVNGYLCRERSVAELKRGLEYLFSPKCDLSALRKNALKSYLENYTLEDLFQETYKFYLAVL